VIRISVGNLSQGNSGFWTATVSWLDGQWDENSGDGVTLSASLAPPLPGHTLWSATPGNAESYQVPGNVTMIYGTANPGTYIQFRIGLQQQYTTSNPRFSISNPVRYGVVTITYGEGKWRRLFIRQGHDPDFIMRTNEPGTPMVSRPNAMRFSPYNLRHPQYINCSHRTSPNFTANSGAFSEYPTRSGFLFPFNVSFIGLAPYLNESLSGWNQNQQGSGTWTTNPVETCPNNVALSYGGTVNYRRPTDGPTNAVVPTPSISNSEMRQSLWSNPPTGTGINVENSSGGYYADGYFDRGPLVTATNSVIYNPGGITLPTNPTGNIPTNHTAVEVLIGASGRVFFNPATNASVFFPAGGYGNGIVNAEVLGCGLEGRYQTSTCVDNGWINSYYFTFNSSSSAASSVMNMASGNRSMFYNVRCVTPPPPPPASSPRP
jgi:hypothetical protein